MNYLKNAFLRNFTNSLKIYIKIKIKRITKKMGNLFRLNSKNTQLAQFTKEYINVKKIKLVK